MAKVVRAKVVRNPNGYPESLRGNRPAQPSFKHGAKGRNPRPYDERSQEIEAELLDLPHIAPMDAPACREIALLMALIERVDACPSPTVSSRGARRPVT